MIFWFWIFLIFRSLWTSLMYIKGELAGGGSVAVAVVVGVSDMWHASSDMWHMTHDMWHLILDPWQFFLSFFLLLSLFWYNCYYPNTSRDSVSTKCRIFFIFGWKLQIMARNVVYSFPNVGMTLKFCDQQKRAINIFLKHSFSSGVGPKHKMESNK